MNTNTGKPLMQQALGAQWGQLPPPLLAHYQRDPNTEVGELDIEYPGFMQPYLSFMHGLGALVNRRGKAITITVETWMEGSTQRWKRTLHFPDGQEILFKSHCVYAGRNELIEYVNACLGMRMAVTVEDSTLNYVGRHYVLKLGRLLLPIPEWLVLGHATVVETALDDSNFSMDFRLTHPWFGELYRYCGVFQTRA